MTEILKCEDCYFNRTCKDKGKVEPTYPANDEDIERLGLTGCLAFTSFDDMRSAEYAGSHNSFFNGGNPNRW